MWVSSDVVCGYGDVGSHSDVMGMWVAIVMWYVGSHSDGLCG